MCLAVKYSALVSLRWFDSSRPNTLPCPSLFIRREGCGVEEGPVVSRCPRDPSYCLNQFSSVGVQ